MKCHRNSELRSMRKDIVKIAKKKSVSRSQTPSQLVNELRAIRKEVVALPHVAHAGGG